MAAILTYWHTYIQAPNKDREHLLFIFDSAHAMNSRALGAFKRYLVDPKYKDKALLINELPDAIKVLENAEKLMFNSENRNALARSRINPKSAESAIERIRFHEKAVEMWKSALERDLDVSVDDIMGLP